MSQKRRITIYYDGSAYTYKWLKVLYVARFHFRELGYKVEWSSFTDMLPGYPYAEEKTLQRMLTKENDIAFLAFHHSTSLLGRMTTSHRAEYLSKIKEHTRTLVWLDTSDSTGTCLFDVMPFVDIYMKKQTLKNKAEYCKPMYGGRIFCDYYHKLIGAEDDFIHKDEYTPLAKQDIGKIRTGWNVGLGDLFTPPSLMGKVSLRNPYRLTNPKLISPQSPKPIDVHYRGSGYSPVAGYQRAKLCELVQAVKYMNHPDPKQKVPHTEYVRELKAAKAILSPFGWGEICGRDFEALQYGAIMVKPSMKHLDTFPNAYKEYETYVPLEWNFSDFDEVMHHIKAEKYTHVAWQGQEAFRNMRSAEGMYTFARHIIEQIES